MSLFFCMSEKQFISLLPFDELPAETVKQLGAQLGRFVLVFNCDDSFDFRAMGRPQGPPRPSQRWSPAADEQQKKTHSLLFECIWHG